MNLLKINRKKIHFFFLLALSLLFFATACFRARPIEQSTKGIEWNKIQQYRANDLILNLHGTPFEVYAITDSEFSRFNRIDTLLEKRPLLQGTGVISRPIMNDNSFVRYTVEDGKDVIEFHLTRNGGQVEKIIANDLKEPADNKVEIDREARLNGAFNKEGTQFVLLTIVNFHYVAFYFDILQNMEHDEFISIVPSTRIDLMDIPEGEDQLQVVRFVNGNYYVGTKSGAYRLTPEGEATKVFPTGQWMIDFFENGNRLFATGFNTFDQHFSLDNGQTWARIGEESDLREVEVVADTIFTHQSLGFPFKMAKPDLKTAVDIIYPQGVETDLGDNNSFYGICYSNGKFYISYEKDIYYVEEISFDE